VRPPDDGGVGVSSTAVDDRKHAGELPSQPVGGVAHGFHLVVELDRETNQKTTRRKERT